MWTRIGFSNSQPNVMMSSTFIVQPYRSVHGSTVSHHELVFQPNTKRKQNESVCRGASSFSSRRRLLRFRASQLFFIAFLWSLLIGATSAANGESSTFAIQVEDDLGWKGSALRIDHRPPPEVPPLMPPLYHDALRNNEDGSKAAYAVLSKRVATTDIPEPFDTGLSNNFTSSCASFLTRLRTNDEFKKCRPFSLMLQVRRPCPAMGYIC